MINLNSLFSSFRSLALDASQPVKPVQTSELAQSPESDSKSEPCFHPFSRLPKELQLKIWAAAVYRPRVFFGAWWTPRDKAGHFKRPASHIKLQDDLALALPLAAKTQSKFRLTCKDAQGVALGYSHHTLDFVFASYSNVSILANFPLDWFVFYCSEIEEGFHAEHSSFMNNYAAKLKNIMLMMDGCVESDAEVMRRLAIALTDFGGLEKVLCLFNNKKGLLDREEGLRITWERKFGGGPVASFATVEQGLRAVGDEYAPHKWIATQKN